ncbi:LysM peptidoglycan-binding domain-containing M23 family metallopeptidase [Roseospira goensis]|uniref:Murein DD-endopeptidase MepM/ murein hydrolase activator NlpD n=1 Tax=Roseospira goensis TaxID=391922 RepID=A0A7W6WKJ4_9PROT|nr:LysM peptidoglycan-binding domain-containing M23 family metallopeptidase [Roseospira goensis]MBB4285658.1 murein DD-endopeptidase MepM/ murein hydrolase activator NlpD [Roseospira goensis]
MIRMAHGLPRLLTLLALAGVALAGCDRGWRDAPYGLPGATGAHGDPTRARQVVVQPGDSVYAIARRTGVPTRAIISANALAPPFILHPGEVLTLPAQRVHEVRAGDTLHALSRRYGPSVAAIANANGLAPPYVIRTGEALVIPATDQPESTPATEPTRAIATMPRPARPPSPQTPGRELAVPSPTRTADPVAAPGAATSPRPTPEPTAAPAQDRSPERPRDVRPAPLPPVPAATGALPPPPPMPTAAVARGAVPLPDPPPRAGSRFLWPAVGEVIAGFGPGRDGLHNDGINIAVPMGAPIRAADAGVVVYAGNEIQGFGNLVLIKHAGGWTTAYAHASRLEVRRGQLVQRGQIIARAGRTGSVDAPQVHFEIRRGARPVDPRDHMGSRTDT